MTSSSGSSFSVASCPIYGHKNFTAPIEPDKGSKFTSGVPAPPKVTNVASTIPVTTVILSSQNPQPLRIYSTASSSSSSSSSTTLSSLSIEKTSKVAKNLNLPPLDVSLDHGGTVSLPVPVSPIYTIAIPSKPFKPLALTYTASKTPSVTFSITSEADPELTFEDNKGDKAFIHFAGLEYHIRLSRGTTTLIGRKEEQQVVAIYPNGDKRIYSPVHY